MKIKEMLIYEDNHIMIVDKPVNVPVQEDSSGDPDLLNMLKQYIKDRDKKPGKVFLGLVHRLDRPVGGVMVFAKTSKAASRLSEQIRQHRITKEYLGVIRGYPERTSAKLVDYLIKDTRANIVRITEKNNNSSKRAELDYRVLQKRNDLSLIEIWLKTGRPHQIRVQFANQGYPLYGDQKYGRGSNKPGQQLGLWSHKLLFFHPVRKEPVGFISMPPTVHPWTDFCIEAEE